MIKTQTGIKLAVPVVFFGYAIAGNIALLAKEDRTELAFDDLLRGGVSSQIDALYRDDLMHKDPAIGLIGAARYALLNEGRFGVVAGQDGWLFTEEEFRPLDRSDPTLDETISFIASVQTQLADAGAELVMLPLPAKLDIARDHISSDETMRAENDYTAFVAGLEEAGITTFDSRTAAAWKATDFLRTDTHWTVAGAEQVAIALATSGPITMGESVYTRHKSATVGFHGDLVSFITSDLFAPMVGLTKEEITPFTAAMAGDDGPIDLGFENAPAGLDIFGAGGATEGIALVGTSYSANPHWSFAEALKLHLQQDVLNYALQGQGPVFPMAVLLKTLESEVPPTVVIWEFPIRYLSDPSLFAHVKEAGNA